MKRGFDILSSLVAIVLFSPILLVLAIIVKCTSPGPILFKQRRIGKDNQEFMIYKFRTMRIDTPNVATHLLKNPEQYITPIGKFMRKTSLDELPQLFNVLIGNMSLVGPRPETPFFVSKFQKSIPQYMLKHYVKPGMTGWAQVNDLRGGDTSIEERIKYDMYYIENWTFMFDIKILFMTLTKGIFSKNGF